MLQNKKPSGLSSQRVLVSKLYLLHLPKPSLSYSIANALIDCGRDVPVHPLLSGRCFLSDEQDIFNMIELYASFLLKSRISKKIY
jgi:hypothetical protein